MSRTRLAAVLCSTFFAAFAANAQDARQNKPGEFDFYVLALSWSPSFCEAGDERNASSRRPDPQCGERPYSFVVHGFWPQYERGFPEFCEVPAPRLDRNIIASMLDLMPAPRLIYREWDRHGTCSGLSARAYFDLKAPLTVAPDAVEEAVVAANPGLARGAIAVGCDSRRLREVRICMTKDLRFRDCDEIDRRACRREQLVMPPVRRAKSAARE